MPLWEKSCATLWHRRFLSSYTDQWEAGAALPFLPFETLCGSNPLMDLCPLDEYRQGVNPSTLQALVQRDYRQGIEILSSIQLTGI